MKNKKSKLLIAIICAGLLVHSVFAGCVFSYDSNGNLLTDTQCNQYQYNAQNQLVDFKDSKNKQTYQYDYNANGLRQSKVYNDIKINFLYDGSRKITDSIEVGKNISSAYLQHEVRYVAQASNTTTQYYAKSNHNQTNLLLNAKLAITGSYNYTPFGQARAFTKQQTPNADPIFNNPLTYDGEYQDAESGLIYLRARFYNPRLMHFMQRDSYKLTNRYTFANDNPINMIDPQGHFSFSDLFSDFNFKKAFKNPKTFFAGLGTMIAGGLVMYATGGVGLFCEGGWLAGEEESAGLLSGVGKYFGKGSFKAATNGALHMGGAAAFSTGMNMDVLAGRGVSLYKGNKILRSFAWKQLSVAAIVGAGTGLAGFMSSGIGGAITKKTASSVAGYMADVIVQGGIGASAGIAYTEGMVKYVYGVDIPTSMLLQPALAGGLIGAFAGLGVRYKNGSVAEPPIEVAGQEVLQPQGLLAEDNAAEQQPVPVRRGTYS